MHILITVLFLGVLISSIFLHLDEMQNTHIDLCNELLTKLDKLNDILGAIAQMYKLLYILEPC